MRDLAGCFVFVVGSLQALVLAGLVWAFIATERCTGGDCDTAGPGMLGAMFLVTQVFLAPFSLIAIVVVVRWMTRDEESPPTYE